MKIYDTITIGGGQAGLSVAYFLRTSSLDFLIIDDQKEPGGGWLKTWDSLTLFSPTEYSSLSGWQMPKSKEQYPTRNEFLDYLKAYQKRYHFPVRRGINVSHVEKINGIFKLKSSVGEFYSKTLVSATGTAGKPFIPNYSNSREFEGIQMHSVDYRNADSLVGRNVLVVGGGNSGAQILSEVSKVAKTKWVTLTEPLFLPEDIDGRYLFMQANASYYGNEISTAGPQVSLSKIVQVASVQDGIRRKVYSAVRSFKYFYENGVVWENDEKESFDTIIWCTGFRPGLQHLEGLNIFKYGRIQTQNTRSIEEPSLWLVGYGNWTGFASATIYGVGKTARATAREITAHFEKSH